MIFTLLWLTVSTPFILTIQQELNGKNMSSAVNDSMDENSNPFSGFNEEKCSANTLSEYLHESVTLQGFDAPELEHCGSTGSGIYIAHYGELVSPPPEG
ncbi:MAG TPA: hypothetical protein VFV68_14655 [Agriterribacter sp.]|nr:hypothetical protein [Agriterribacter sp.]